MYFTQVILLNTYLSWLPDNALATHKEVLVTLLFEALTSESHALCCAGITGLVALVTLKEMITHDQVSFTSDILIILKGTFVCDFFPSI